MSRRAAAGVLTLEARMRAAGVPESRLASVEKVALAGHHEGDRDVFETVARPPKEAWERHRSKPHDVDKEEIANLKRTVERTARARGEAPAKAGRKRANPELLPLRAARHDGEFDAAVDAARAECPVAADDLHDALNSFYADDRAIDDVRNEVYGNAARMNDDEIVETGAHTTLPTGKNWMPEHHDVSKSVAEVSTVAAEPSSPELTGEDDAPTFEV